MHLPVRYQPILLGLALLVGSFVLYWPTLGNGFVWDAESVFLEDTSLQSLSNLFSGFSAPMTNSFAEDGKGVVTLKYYRPLTKAFHVIEYQIFGPEPFGYNFVNVTLHGIVTLLLFALITSVHGNPLVAFFAALLFMVKPTHTEAVAWSYSDSYLLTAVFALASLLAFRHKHWVIAFVAFVFALFFHEMGILLLPTLLLYAALVENRTTRKDLVILVPYLLATIVFLWLRHSIVGPLPLPEVGFTAFANTAAFIFQKFLKIFVWPDAPVTVYQRVLYTHLNPQVLIGYVLLVTTAALAWRMWLKDRVLLFWLLWFVVWSAVSYNIGRLGDYLLAEKIIYTASAGLCVVAAVLLHRQFVTRPIPVYVVLSCVSLTYAVATWQRLPYWKSTEAYVVKALEHAPDFYSAWYALANVYIKEERYDQALVALERAVANKPAFSPALNNIGNIHFIYGRLPQAIASWREALRGDATNPQPYFNIGIALQKMGRMGEALGYYEQYLARVGQPDVRAKLQIDELRRELGRSSRRNE